MVAGGQNSEQILLPKLLGVPDSLPIMHKELGLGHHAWINYL